MRRIKLKNVGPIATADVSLGDLTVLVGPQATGKSILLQFLKLIEDKGHIRKTLGTYGFEWSLSEWAKFFPDYFGEGMGGMWRENSKIEFSISEFKRIRSGSMKTFYIPAQRVLSIETGWPKPFTGFDATYPYTSKEFSETIRQLMDEQYKNSPEIFPHTKRLKKELREAISESIFRNSKVRISKRGSQKILSLVTKAGEGLPVATWSAGQREFIPLLLGLHWLMPSSKISRRGKISLVIIEEPEMGLHPNAILGVILSIMELLNRGYRVAVSTHSQTFLEVMWGLREIQRSSRKDAYKYFLKMFKLSATGPMKSLAVECIGKTFRTYFFRPDRKGMVTIENISDLDLDSESPHELNWGELTEFSGHVGDVVSDVYKDLE